MDREEEYKVEKVIDAKQIGKQKKWHYLIKWKGYPASDNSWPGATTNTTPFDLIMGYVPQAVWPTKLSGVPTLKA